MMTNPTSSERDLSPIKFIEILPTIKSNFFPHIYNHKMRSIKQTQKSFFDTRFYPL